MKYIINESKLDKVIFKYLDNMGLIQIRKGDNIFFDSQNNDEFYRIIYYIPHEFCYISARIYYEIRDVFHLGFDEIKKIVARWVEDTLQMNVSDVFIHKNLNFHKPSFD